MNIKLMESLKKIANDKETLKQIENSDCSLKDIYDICKEYGFTDSYEVFEKDYEELFAYLINEIKEEELSYVSGGKMNRFFSKSTAALLSALTLSTTAIPMSSAANHNNLSSANTVVNFVRKNPGKSLALLATAIAVPVGVTTLGITGYKLFSKDEKTTSTNNETFNEKTTPTSNETFNEKVIIDQEYITKKISNCNKDRDKIQKNLDDNTKSNIVSTIQDGIINSNKKNNNIVDVLLAEIKLLKDNNCAENIIDFIMLVNTDHICNGFQYEDGRKKLESAISSYNYNSNPENIEKRISDLESELSGDEKIIFNAYEANNYDINNTIKHLVSSGTMTQEKVNNCLGYSLNKLNDLGRLKLTKKDPKNKTNIINNMKESMNKLPPRDMIDAMNDIMIFLGVLKNNVKSPKKRMNICNDLESSLKRAAMSIDTYSYIRSAFTMNRIQLKIIN